MPNAGRARIDSHWACVAEPGVPGAGHADYFCRPKIALSVTAQFFCLDSCRDLPSPGSL
jgi:hypothetical protein